MRRWFLPVLLAGLSLISILLLKSVAPSLAGTQLVYFILGFGLFFVVAHTSWPIIIRWRWVAYVVVCALLVVPLVLGTTTRGIAGWIDVGTLFSIQPSQLAIPVVSLLLAYELSRIRQVNLQQFVRVLAIIALPGILILVEPDLGTTVIYLLTMAVLLWFGPFPFKYLAGVVGLMVIAMILGWFLVLKDYQKERITSFVSVNSDVSDAGYNAHQALIAVGSGEVIGRGLGQGVQSHLRFLPERQTDFIFASLAEELGFVGSIFVVSIYVMISLFCIYIAVRVDDPAARLLCLAIAGATIFQSSINMGMNMGLFPITGITLPFLSYGGSSILSMAITYGLVQNVVGQTRPRLSLHLT